TSKDGFESFKEQFLNTAVYDNVLTRTSEDGFESFEEQFSNTAIHNNVSTRTSENSFESFEEQVSNTAAQFQIISRSDSIRIMDASAVRQIFGIMEFVETADMLMNIKVMEDEDETSNSSSSDKENFIKIENLIINSKRGASRKKHFKSSSELKNKSNSNNKYSEVQKTQKPTQC
ncbi:26_t:CDS:2, partial [Racocetra persica]